MKDKKIIVISGPTASGKTSLAVNLAKKFDGEIISADSRQVYKGLDIGTGKDLQEYGDVKYHLIDICKPGEKFTLFDWLPLARKKIDEIISRKKLPIVVGGTGLYVKALIEGYEIKTQTSNLKSQNVKKYSREFLDKQSAEKLIRILKNLDETVLEAIDQKNPRRLIRAIEIAEDGIKQTKSKPDFEILQLAINLPRDVLYQRIDQRVDNRFKEGMLDEVVNLMKKDVDIEWLHSLGLEYRIIGDFVTEKINSESKISKTQVFQDMAQELKWKSHAYARRQLTWLRHQNKIHWVKNSFEAKEIIKKFLKQTKPSE